MLIVIIKNRNRLCTQELRCGRSTKRQGALPEPGRHMAQTQLPGYHNFDATEGSPRERTGCCDVGCILEDALRASSACDYFGAWEPFRGSEDAGPWICLFSSPC